MADKHILRIHETEADLLAELKDKQIAWATDINEAIWRNGNNFYYIEASKYWDGSEFVTINSDQIYNVYDWDDYVTALSDVGNIKYIYMRENIVAPSVLTQNLDVYGQCEIIVYTGSQIFSADPSGASDCELRYRGASSSPNFTSLNFLGNSITYVGFETLFVTDVYCRNEQIISSLPIDVQITNGAELGTSKFQYESQDGNFTCSVGAGDFIRELWTMPIFEIETLGDAEGYKPKGTDFFNNGSKLYSNVTADNLEHLVVGDVYTKAFLGLVVTTAQISGILKTNFVGGSVQWGYSDLDVWNPSAITGNAITFVGRGIDFTNGVSISPDLECSLSLNPSASNDTLKIGDIADTQNDIYVDVLNLDGNVTLDPASTHNIYYQKINLNGFTLTDSGNVAIQQFWRSSTGDKLDSVVAGTNVTIDNTDPQNPIINTTIGGSDTQVQFNDGGSFGGDTGLTYNKSTDSLTVLGGVNVGDVLNLSNTTNSPASAGDIWYDGTSVNLESSLSLTGTTKGIHGNGGDDEFLYITNRSDSLNGANIRLIDSTADGEYGQLRSYTTEVLDWYSNYIKSYVPIRFDAVTPGLSFNGELWYDGTNMRAYEGGVSGKIAYKNVDNNFSTDQAFQGDINASQVLNLASYTNASPANGDIWNDGAKINIQAGLKVKRGNNSTSPALDVLNDANVSVLRFYSDADGDGQFIALTSAGSTIFNLDTDANNGYHVLLNGVQRLGSTANSTPVTGDIWHDSTSGAIEIQGDFKVNASNINFTGLPTSSAGLSAGDLWNDSGTLKIV